MTPTTSVQPARPAQQATRDLEQQLREGRKLRYGAREANYQLSQVPRVAVCGRRRIPGQEVLIQRAQGASCHYSGLESCSSVWACPVCSARIRAGRAEEVERVGLAHLNAGGGLVFVTLTVPHQRFDGLERLFDVVAKGWTRLLAGRAGKALRSHFGVEGYVRAVEITRGDHGWHPHLHCLLFTGRPLDAERTAELEGVIRTRWRRLVVGQGLQEPHWFAGSRVQLVQGGKGAATLAWYLSKVQDDAGNARSVGRELTRADLKRGRVSSSRTPFTILYDLAERLRAAGGDLAVVKGDRDLAAWMEYECVTRGRRFMTWSVGLREAYDVPLTEDEELAALHNDSELETVAVLPREHWRIVLARKGRRAELLSAAETGGAIRVWTLIRRWQLRDQREERRRAVRLVA